jgi:ADP-ribose pyrophosphatase YjhB (NUDIX family)
MGEHENPPQRPRIDAKHTADLVVLTIRDNQLKILLVVRRNDPFRGKLALPGGFLRPDEDLEQTARRELAEETGLDPASAPLLQLHTYSAPDRDPRGRVITTAFIAIAPNLSPVAGATDARSADWVEFHESLRDQLAFDHWVIVDKAMTQIRSELEYTSLAVTFCPPFFTMSELRRVFELIWNVSIDPGNFRRKVNSISGFIETTGQYRKSGDGGRPAELYRLGRAKALNPPLRRPAR